MPVRTKDSPLDLAGFREWLMLLVIIAGACMMAWALLGCEAPAPAMPQPISEVIRSRQWVRTYHNKKYNGRPASIWSFTRPELTTVWAASGKYMFKDAAYTVQVIVDQETRLPSRVDVYHDMQDDGKAVQLWVFVEPKIVLLRGMDQSYGFGRVPRK
jgi:hypothetical protein